MLAFRFVLLAFLACTLSLTASAQPLPVVRIASEIEVADRGPSADSLDGIATQVAGNGWLLTDRAVDPIAESAFSEMEVEWIDSPEDAPIIEELPESDCECGQNHCYGVCRDPGHPAKPWLTKPGDRDRGDCPPLRYRMNDCERAGNPHCYHRWATCSVNEKYSAWFVGGGSPFRLGKARTSSEGTWGLDYGGFFGHAKVWLNYTHGRNQGGVGGYRTDGEPKVVSKAHELLHLGHK